MPLGYHTYTRKRPYEPGIEKFSPAEQSTGTSRRATAVRGGREEDCVRTQPLLRPEHDRPSPEASDRRGEFISPCLPTGGNCIEREC